MSSAKPGKVDEIHEASKSSNDEHTSKRKAVDANATDVRSQNRTQYNEGPHQYGPPDTARQTGNVADGTYSREKVKIRYYAARICPIKSCLLVQVATQKRVSLLF